MRARDLPTGKETREELKRLSRKLLHTGYTLRIIFLLSGCCLLYFCYSTNYPVQAGDSPFWCSLFGTKFGIHLAAGPDMMHLMMEGIAMHIIGCTIKVLKEAGT